MTATADPNDPNVTPDMLDPDAPASVIVRSTAPERPKGGPTLGIDVPARPPEPRRHRLVTLGDSLTHGFKSGAIYDTHISWPMIVAWEMGWDAYMRYPKYEAYGGLFVNIEYLLGILEHEFDSTRDWWAVPRAGFRIRSVMDEIECYWERGPGATVPEATWINHNLGIYGWDVRDALSSTYEVVTARIGKPHDNLIMQITEAHSARAGQRVLSPKHPKAATVDLAKVLGEDGGIETLVVALGVNNALSSVLRLDAKWSKAPQYWDPEAKAAFTVWDPDHFALEWAQLIEAVSRIDARHVIVATVPHVTIIPIARGVGDKKMREGSRYWDWYTRPWIKDEDFNPDDDACLPGVTMRAIDAAVDQYNETIVESVRAKRKAGHDWYLLDLCGILDRLAFRRYQKDLAAQPSWWTPYELPAELAALAPVPDSRFYDSGATGRTAGGLFSLDGTHPTTIGYGIMAQEIIDIMQLAGVPFYFGTSGKQQRVGRVQVDFRRLIQRDSLIHSPPKLFSDLLATVGWLDETLDLLTRLGKGR